MVHFCTYCAVLAVVLAALAYQFVSLHDLGVSFEVVSARPHPSETMKAVVYFENGPPEVLVFEKEWPRPVPRPHQVLIRVAAAAVNPCDFKFRRNPAPWPISVKPSVPGEDVAGIVVEAPSNSKFKPGDRVAAMMDILGSRWGASAEYAAVPQDYLARIPDSISFSEAASVPLVALTTVQAFDMVEGGLRGKKVLVQAGAGGVGSFAIQYAKQQGAKLIATTCSAAKAEFVRELGADIAVDYRTTDFEDVIENFDVVFDTMGFLYEGRTLNSGRRVLADGGHYLNILSSDWSLTDDGQETTGTGLTIKNLLKFKARKLMGKPGPKYDTVTVVPNGNQLQEILDSMGKGEIKAVIDQTFPMQQAAEAHRYLETGHATGKVLLSVP